MLSNRIVRWGALALFGFFSVLATAEEVSTTSGELTERKKTTDTELENKKKSKPNDKVEKIEVTGSYIRRVDVEGPSPLVTIDRSEFDNSGNTTVEDVLKENAYFEAVLGEGKDSSYEGHIRFHGQHAGNTLILLNGLRLPKESGGFYTSVSYIPSQAVEKVELLKDGSAALYGSDAMAGVVNFITRKDYTGTSISTKYSTNSEGLGTEQSYTASFGKGHRKGSYLVMAQYRQLEPFTEYDLGSRGSIDQYSQQIKNSGTIEAGNQLSHFGPSCADVEGQCRTDSNIYDEIQVESEDIGTLLTTDYEISDSTRVSFVGIYNRKNQIKTHNPLPVNLEARFEGLKNSSLGKRFADLGATDDDIVTFSGRLNQDLGALVEERISDTASAQFQINQDFADTWNWKWSTGYTFQQVERQNIAGDADRHQLNSMFAQGKINPMIGGNDLSDASAAPIRRNQGQMINTRLVSSGEIMDWGDGFVSLAVGTELEYEDFAFNHDGSVVRGDNISYQANNFEGFRRVNSLFVEISASPHTAFEMQLAGRFDHYNDVGSTVNPKLGIGYRPHNTTLLRASYGTGFKPPGVSDMFMPSYDTKFPFNDPTGNFDNHDATVVRNQNITFETSTHYNFGVVYQPVRSSTFTIDQWNFEGEGTISNFTGRQAMEFLEAHGTEGLDNVKKYGLEIELNSDGTIKRLQVPNVFNRAQKILRGVDFSADFDLKGRLFGQAANYSISDTISHIYERKERQFEFSKLVDKELYGTKNTIRANVGFGPHFAQLSARTQLNGDRDSVREGWKFPVYTEYDMTYALASKSYGKFSLTIKNIVNSSPEVDTKGQEVPIGDRSQLFSPLGRRFVLGYTLDI